MGLPGFRRRRERDQTRETLTALCGRRDGLSREEPMPRPQSPHVFTSRLYLYALPHDEHPFWGVGWINPDAYFCDVTPEQDAEYQRWWSTTNTIDDVSKVRMSGWPSLLADTVEFAVLTDAPEPVGPKIQPQFAGKIGVGWIARGRVWISSNVDVSDYHEWLVCTAMVETDTRTGARQFSRGW